MAKAKPLSKASRNVAETLKKMDVAGVEFRGLKSEEKERNKRLEGLKEELKPLVMELGQENEKGDYELGTGLLIFKLRKKERVTVNEEAAKELLRKKGLLAKATKMVVDTDAVRQLFAEEYLTEDDIGVILKSTPSHDFMTPELAADKKESDDDSD